MKTALPIALTLLLLLSTVDVDGVGEFGGFGGETQGFGSAVGFPSQAGASAGVPSQGVLSSSALSQFGQQGMNMLMNAQSLFGQGGGRGIGGKVVRRRGVGRRGMRVGRRRNMRGGRRRGMRGGRRRNLRGGRRGMRGGRRRAMRPGGRRGMRGGGRRRG